MSDEGWLLHPEYRVRFAEGELFFNGSLTDDGEEGLSGHLDSRGRWHINDVWRAGFDSELSAFDGYRDRYGFPRPTWLTNRGYVEAFADRSYAALEGFAYDDTRVDRDDDENPLVLPLMTYAYESAPGVLGGGRALLDASVQGIHRADGASGTRVSGSVGWTRPGATSWGLAYDLEARLNTDLYWVEDANQVAGDPDSGFDGTVARAYPSARARLRYPMVRVGAGHRQVLEPLVTVAMTPPDLNTKRIPNEDSLDPRLDHTTLFTGDRTAGRDRVDDGVSVNYGLRWSYLDDGGGSVSAQFGQAWRAFDSDFFPSRTGYGDGLSDYVGSLDIRPTDTLDLFYRFRLDRDDLSPNTTVLGFRAGTAALNVGGTYVSTADREGDGDDDLPRREEIVASVGTAFSRYWNAYAGGRYNLADDRAVDLWGGLTYEDECLILALDYTSSYNEVNGEDRGDSVVLRITLKTLGELSF
nr:LPS assembly protein LptD [Roseospira goensis]